MDGPMSRDIARADAAPAEPLTDASICLVGLGYVGLPLAVAFDDAGFDVIGFDVDDARVDTLDDAVDPTATVGDASIAESEVEFTTNPGTIERADYVIIAVPTPITDSYDPDLTFVQSAGRTVGRHLTPDTTVVLESTVYPGATEEVLAPAIEESSGYVCGQQFEIGYSPERATAGDDEHGLDKVVKVVSAQTDEVLDDLATLYSHVVDAGIYRAPDIETAEAAKVLENVQRDVNIALMNEMAIAFDHIDLDTDAVLDAASTKWNFHDYRPGLVAGHCIPVDPYYLVHRAEHAGFTPALVRTSREVNSALTGHVVDLVRDGLAATGRTLDESTLLVMGLTYKPDVSDVSETAVGDVISDLQDEATVVGYDPHADDQVVRETFGIQTTTNPSFQGFDGVVVLTPHEAFDQFDPHAIANAMTSNPVMVDLQSAFDRDEVSDAGFEYRTL